MRSSVAPDSASPPLLRLRGRTSDWPRAGSSRPRGHRSPPTSRRSAPCRRSPSAHKCAPRRRADTSRRPMESSAAPSSSRPARSVGSNGGVTQDAGPMAGRRMRVEKECPACAGVRVRRTPRPVRLGFRGCGRRCRASPASDQSSALRRMSHSLVATFGRASVPAARGRSPPRSRRHTSRPRPSPGLVGGRRPATDASEAKQPMAESKQWPDGLTSPPIEIPCETAPDDNRRQRSCSSLAPCWQSRPVTDLLPACD